MMLDQLPTAVRDALACPACHRHLQPAAGALSCPSCQLDYTDTGAFLDFAAGAAMKPGLGPLYLQDPLHVPRYEPLTRRAFVSIMARNQAGDLDDDAEDTYIREHLAPVEGPVLDLACGAGRWTRTVVRHVGEVPVIGLDLNTAMLTAIHTALPDLPLVRADALRLPFGDGTLGAVNCSNALQLLPDPHRVLAEVGRCLAPGGVLTVFSFRAAHRPAYRHFQRRHEAVFGVRSFEPAEVAGWLQLAGMDLLHLDGPAGALLFTARRRPRP